MCVNFILLLLYSFFNYTHSLFLNICFNLRPVLSPLTVLSGYFFLSSGNPVLHGLEPLVPRVRPSCSLFPRASVSSSFSLSGMKSPSLTAFIAFLIFSIGKGSSLCRMLYIHFPSESNVPHARKTNSLHVLPNRLSLG